jgi:hypothetical protein
MDHRREGEPVFQGLIWREPKSPAEALALLRLAGALSCRGCADISLMVWLSSQDQSTVLNWFTAYGSARAYGQDCGDHELAHAFDFLTRVHPKLRPVMLLMFP